MENKNSQIRQLPTGWELKKIKQCFKFKNGKGFSGELKEKADSEFCYPVYGGNGIIGYCNNPLLEKTTIIVGRVGEYCGNVFKTQEKSWVTDNAMLVSEVLLNDFDINFWSVMLNSLHFNHYSDSTGQPKITQGGIGAITVVYPKSVVEQTAIADILSKVDGAIASVQNSIAAAERLKKSLMQYLLTGKMKPDGTFRTPEEFYIDEKFGKVPVGWDCDRFKQFAVLQRGNDLTDSEVVPGNYPVIKSNGFSIWHNQYFVEPPGVVTGRSGTIGKVFYIEEKFWAHNTTLYVKDFKGNVPKYIYYLILSMDFSRYFAGTTVPTLNRNDIHKLKIAIPNSRTEQQQIVSEIDAIVNTIQQKRQKIDTLEHLKKSLMQNLLTGKIKINN